MYQPNNRNQLQFSFTQHSQPLQNSQQQNSQPSWSPPIVNSQISAPKCVPPSQNQICFATPQTGLTQQPSHKQGVAQIQPTQRLQNLNIQHGTPAQQYNLAPGNQQQQHNDIMQQLQSPVMRDPPPKSQYRSLAAIQSQQQYKTLGNQLSMGQEQNLPESMNGSSPFSQGLDKGMSQNGDLLQSIRDGLLNRSHIVQHHVSQPPVPIEHIQQELSKLTESVNQISQQLKQPEEDNSQQCEVINKLEQVVVNMNEIKNMVKKIIECTEQQGRDLIRVSQEFKNQLNDLMQWAQEQQKQLLELQQIKETVGQVYGYVKNINSNMSEMGTIATAFQEWKAQLQVGIDQQGRRLTRLSLMFQADFNHEVANDPNLQQYDDFVHNMEKENNNPNTIQYQEKNIVKNTSGTRQYQDTPLSKVCQGEQQQHRRTKRQRQELQPIYEGNTSDYNVGGVDTGQQPTIVAKQYYCSPLNSDTRQLHIDGQNMNKPPRNQREREYVLTTNKENTTFQKPIAQKLKRHKKEDQHQCFEYFSSADIDGRKNLHLQEYVNQACSLKQRQKTTNNIFFGKEADQQHQPNDLPQRAGLFRHEQKVNRQPCSGYEHCNVQNHVHQPERFRCSNEQRTPITYEQKKFIQDTQQQKPCSPNADLRQHCQDFTRNELLPNKRKQQTQAQKNYQEKRQQTHQAAQQSLQDRNDQLQHNEPKRNLRTQQNCYFKNCDQADYNQFRVSSISTKQITDSMSAVNQLKSDTVFKTPSIRLKSNNTITQYQLQNRKQNKHELGRLNVQKWIFADDKQFRVSSLSNKLEGQNQSQFTQQNKDKKLQQRSQVRMMKVNRSDLRQQRLKKLRN